MIDKVPANDTEALKSNLMGWNEKRKCKNFFQFVQSYEQDNPKTWPGHMNLQKIPFESLIKEFGLSKNTVDFIGHAVALYTNEDFKKNPAIEVYKKIVLYMNSMGAYGDSPFIYPIYGLAGIPEGFSRKCALFGGTFMLNKKVDKFIFDDNGKVCGV